MPAAHVFVDDLSSPVLDDADRHHLQRVLRLRDGEEVTASDGRGGVLPCRFVGGALEPDGAATVVARRDPAVTIGFAPVKGDRPEWAVQKLTEIGVDRIVALRCDRSVVRWDDDRAPRHLARWRRVAREAAMQSRRAWLPEIDGVATPVELRAAALSLEPVVDPTGAAPGHGEADRTPPESLAAGGVARADLGGAPPDESVHTVLVGPEGGWSEAERSVLPAVGLTRTVLRTETAAVAAAVLICTLQDRAIGRGARSTGKF